MRLSIRNEQMAVIESVAQENFVRRIADHLLAEYPKSVVTLPVGEKMTVDELPEEKLYELVRVGIEKARRYEMTIESAIAAFVAVMFDVAPNFDTHRLCQVLLMDEETEPDRRLDEILDLLTDQNWESIRAEYDPLAWNRADEVAETTATQGEPKESRVESKDPVLDETVRVDFRK